jgi:hypothetical protein
MASQPQRGIDSCRRPSTLLTLDDALRVHAERVATNGAELARSLGLDAEPLAIALGRGHLHQLKLTFPSTSTSRAMGWRRAPGFRSRQADTGAEGPRHALPTTERERRPSRMKPTLAVVRDGLRPAGIRRPHRAGSWSAAPLLHRTRALSGTGLVGWRRGKGSR